MLLTPLVANGWSIQTSCVEQYSCHVLKRSDEVYIIASPIPVNFNVRYLLVCPLSTFAQYRPQL